MSLLNVKAFLVTVGFNFVYVYKYFALEHPNESDMINDLCIDSERQLSRSIKNALKEVDLDIVHSQAKLAKDKKTAVHKAAVKVLAPAVEPAFPSVEDYRTSIKKIDDLRDEVDYMAAENRFLQDELNSLNTENMNLKAEGAVLRSQVVHLNNTIRHLQALRQAGRAQKWKRVEVDFESEGTEDTLTK